MRTVLSKKGKSLLGLPDSMPGSVGKVENCQVGVFAAYVWAKGDALVDQQLWMPESWFDADHAERRAKCRVAKGMTFRSQPELAADMLRAIPERGSVALSPHGGGSHLWPQSGVSRCYGGVYRTCL